MTDLRPPCIYNFEKPFKQYISIHIKQSTHTQQISQEIEKLLKIAPKYGIEIMVPH